MQQGKPANNSDERNEPNEHMSTPERQSPSTYTRDEQAHQVQETI